MEELRSLSGELLNVGLIRMTMSNPRSKEGAVKVKVRPVETKEGICFQFEAFTKTQAFHENLKGQEAAERLQREMLNFRQLQAETVTEDITVLVSKKGKVTVQRKRAKSGRKQAESLSHNRQKSYILEEGRLVPFLQDLGVMTETGKIVRSRFDKFRQINRFLEFIEDILPQLDKGRELTVLDFGCGKSYLTFAMYHYLYELKGYPVRIIGLDLKQEVIENCSRLAEKYGYDRLTFLVGDIADYEGVEQVDLVVTLHACDTATDYALAKAVGWNAKVILSVPCCQHELNGQMEVRAEGGWESAARSELAPIMEYGLLRERFAALVTDGLRAAYLEREGYDTQVLEFIDMEHTPKNILLRAVRRGKGRESVGEALERCEKFLNVRPTLGALLSEQKGRINEDDKEDN